MRRLAAVGGLALAVLSPVTAAADDDERVWQHTEAQVTLEVAERFEIAAGEGPLLAITGPGVRGTLLRIDRANRSAWLDRETFFEQVETGAEAIAGYRRIRSQRMRLGRVPAMDLWFSRTVGDGRETVAMRMIFFRRYTMILTLAETGGRGRSVRREVRDMLASFAPYFASEPEE